MNHSFKQPNQPRINDSQNHRRVDEEVAQSSAGIKRNFSFQPLSLARAVAPCLSKPTAPFGKNERKKAYTSALYYSECFLHGIEPVDADSAAEIAQGTYDKWWVKATGPDNEPVSSGMDKTPNGLKSRNSFQQKSTSQLEHVKKWQRVSTDHDITPTKNIISTNTKSCGGAGPPSSTIEASFTSTDDQNNDPARPPEEPRDLPSGSFFIRSISMVSEMTNRQINDTKKRLVTHLQTTGGNTDTPEFTQYLDFLNNFYQSKNWDGRWAAGKNVNTPFHLDGTWLTLSKPGYNECKGRNEKGEYMYNMGRLSFDMFKPTGLVCSIQAVFNIVTEMDPKSPGRPLYIPRTLQKEIQEGTITGMRSYDILVALTIEPNQTRRGTRPEPSSAPSSQPGDDYVVTRPIRGILTTQGYLLPDPDVPNRMSIWFSGGSLEVQDDVNDVDEWKRIFDFALAPKRDLREYANILAAKFLLGAHIPEEMEPDGTMNFYLKRPIGGHGSAYCDILYMDETLRIMRGHRGSMFVCTRVPPSETQ